MVVNDVFQEVDAEQYLRFSPARKVIIGGILSFCSFLAPISSTSILSAIPEGRRPVQNREEFILKQQANWVQVFLASAYLFFAFSIGTALAPNLPANQNFRILTAFQETSCLVVWELRVGRCTRASSTGNSIRDIPGCTLVYGWTVEKAVRGIPVLVIAMFFQGVVQPFCFPSLNTYSLDFMYLSGRSAEVVAGSCLLRCVFGALGSGLVLPAIESMGVGWFSTISALYLLVSGVGAWLTTISGDQWRDKAERKNQRKAEESAEEVQQNTTKAEA
ncbi:hypothetical protein PDIDSM_6874 [Penicillium digitatum]|nr:hypothetical protein PDIDSM_6874 [Penicillium digitatum]